MLHRVLLPEVHQRTRGIDILRYPAEAESEGDQSDHRADCSRPRRPLPMDLRWLDRLRHHRPVLAAGPPRNGRRVWRHTDPRLLARSTAQCRHQRPHTAHARRPTPAARKHREATAGGNQGSARWNRPTQKETIHQLNP